MMKTTKMMEPNILVRMVIDRKCFVIITIIRPRIPESLEYDIQEGNQTKGEIIH